MRKVIFIPAMALALFFTACNNSSGGSASKDSTNMNATGTGVNGDSSNMINGTNQNNGVPGAPADTSMKTNSGNSAGAGRDTAMTRNNGIRTGGKKKDSV